MTGIREGARGLGGLRADGRGREGARAGVLARLRAGARAGALARLRAGARAVEKLCAGVRGAGVWLALVLLLILALAQPGRAQEEALKKPPDWQATLAQGQEMLGDADASTEDLEALRERLLRLRSAAIDLESQATGKVNEINGRITELGPVPAEGATEAPEVADLRRSLAAQLSDAQAPVVSAQDAARQADLLIRDIDRVVRARFTAELRSRGPSPLDPRTWPDAADSAFQAVTRFHADVAASFADPAARRLLIGRVPFDLLMAAIGIGIAFFARRRLVGWVENSLAHAHGPRVVAGLVALRNFSRLIVPSVGAGLIFAALDPARLTDPGMASSFFRLPAFVVVAIAAPWLAQSIFAPKLPAYRLTPLSDEMAARGARLTLGLGLVLAVYLLVKRYVLEWDLNAEALTLAVFPLFLVGALLLWRMSRVIGAIRSGLLAWNEGGVPPEQKVGSVGLGLLEIIRIATLAVAVAAPGLAAGGYLAAASYLMFSTIFTLAIAATGMVLFDLLTTLLGGLASGAGGERGTRNFHREGLMPVAVGLVLFLIGVPFLALIWGARYADLANVLYLLRDGVTYGGMRISLGMVVTFVLVFGLLYGLTRVLQSALRNTVLPRTRMDAGGRNALVTGVGYIGFIVATVAAVSSTGLDLSSLAFVAGALSVGIGFGMQNVVSNFVSGVILLVERPIKEGDWIEVGGFSGYVRRISVRSTVVETFDRASVIVPNTNLIAGTVLNRTHMGLSGRLQVPVAVALDADPRKVERLLLDIAENYPLALSDPSPRVLLLEIGPDAYLFEIRCWLRDVNFSLSAKSDLNFEILDRLRAEGVRLQPFARETWSTPAHVPAPLPAPDRPPGGPT